MAHDAQKRDGSDRPGSAGQPDAAASELAQVDRRVLVVEDEPRMREMLIRAISEMEFTVAGAGSAEAALREIEATPRGILLVDLNLPGMGGIELCERVRQRWPATQMIILTGHGSLEAAKAAIHLDVVDFLTKPCGLNEIESALDRALRRRRHRILIQPLPDRAWGDDEDLDDLDDDASSGKGSDRQPTLHELERRHILAALDRHHDNRSAAAEELGISLRTLYYRLKEYGRDA
ncbi:MAG: response regulator [Phycisphaerales bacterium]|jgi:DNA-binding NtrC family response regulator